VSILRGQADFLLDGQSLDNFQTYDFTLLTSERSEELQASPGTATSIELVTKL